MHKSEWDYAEPRVQNNAHSIQTYMTSFFLLFKVVRTDWWKVKLISGKCLRFFLIYQGFARLDIIITFHCTEENSSQTNKTKERLNENRGLRKTCPRPLCFKRAFGENKSTAINYLKTFTFKKVNYMLGFNIKF